jgi:hypothetical protein
MTKYRTQKFAGRDKTLIHRIKYSFCGDPEVALGFPGQSPTDNKQEQDKNKGP